MDPEVRAELLTLRAMLILTLAEVANLRPDTETFLSTARDELVRALANIRIEPEAYQDEVRARAVGFAKDWFTHMHFKDPGAPGPTY